MSIANAAGRVLLTTLMSKSLTIGQRSFRLLRGIPGNLGDFFILVITNPMGATLCAVTVLAALLLPPSGLNMPMCSTLVTTGTPCPGCGLTRSVTSIYHGHFLAAWQYNPFGYAVALVALMGTPTLVIGSRRRESLRMMLERIRIPIGVVLTALFFGFIAFGVTRITLVASGHESVSWWQQENSVPPAFRHLVESSGVTPPAEAEESLAPVPAPDQD